MIMTADLNWAVSKIRDRKLHRDATGIEFNFTLLDGS